MRCPYCGRWIDLEDLKDNGGYCPYCDSDLEDDSAYDEDDYSDEYDYAYDDDY